MFERVQLSSSNKENDSNNYRSKNNFFQSKLSVNDGDEQEANLVADKITDNHVASNLFFNPVIQRKADGDVSSCCMENYTEKISGGNSLNASEKSFFESRMKYDFSKVRIHNDNYSNESAKKINALAYTRGNNIVFGPNQYKPGT